ncbi:hypothetical protein EJB05_04000 [Eragrostis curvula]|uniref:Uncharacterized protein n=1 Tax=Eragrostis curvula TaxID=38414 RepID=A0A5J9W9H7_9POAL|nr:hypothetical protein EJB05_04000 [Eragrostis curvula]
MSGAAAALLRSVARRSMTSMKALPRPHPQPTAGLPPRLLFHGRPPRRQDLLPPVVASSRLFSSGSLESPNKDQIPLSPCTEPASAVETNKQEPLTFREYIEQKNEELLKYSRNKQVLEELGKQIDEKKKELLHLLLQMDADQSNYKESEKCKHGNEQLLHLLQEFEATKAQAPKAPSAAGLIKLVNFATLAFVLVCAMKF